MTAPPRPDPLERDVFRAAFRALRRRGWLFTSVAAVTLAVACTGIGVAPRRYMATTDVLLGDREADSVHLKEFTLGGILHEEALADEVVIAQSDEVLRRVAADLQLAADPEFNHRLRHGALDRLRARLLPNGPDEARTEETDVVEALRRHLSVAPVGHSRVLRVSAVSTDPVKAAALANAESAEWRAAHADLQAAMNRDAHRVVEARLADLRARADSSAEAVAGYRAEHGLVRGAAGPAQQELDEAVRNLSAASQHLSEVEATRDQATRALADGSFARLGPVLGSANLERLQELEATAQSQPAKLADRVGPAHPEVQAAAAEYASLRDRADLERRRIAARLVDDVRSARDVRDAAARRLEAARRAVAEADRGEAGLEALQRVADADQALYQAFLARSKETGPDAEVQIGNLQEIARATPPVRPGSPNVPVLLAIAAAGSLLAGGLAVLAAEARRRGLISEEEVESVLGKPSLGLLPRCKEHAPALHDAASELLVRVSQHTRSSKRVCVAVTSALPGEGKSTAAVLLARAGAQQGRRVLLVDGDLRRASLTRQLLNTRKGVPGLAELLNGRLAPADAIRELEREPFSFLPAGEPVGRPINLLACRPGFLGPDATRGFDLVVIDTPPVLVGGDTALLAREADQTVFLARWATTPPANANAALRRLDASRVRVAGVALSRVNTRLNAHYGHGEAVAYSPRLATYHKVGAA